MRKKFPLFQLQDSSSHSPNPRALAVCHALSGLDCEQSLFFFRFIEGGARERRGAKPREARNERGSPRRRSNLAPLVTRVVICVSRKFCSTDQEKRETARSLYPVCVERNSVAGPYLSNSSS